MGSLGSVAAVPSASIDAFHSLWKQSRKLSVLSRVYFSLDRSCRSDVECEAARQLCSVLPNGVRDGLLPCSALYWSTGVPSLSPLFRELSGCSDSVGLGLLGGRPFLSGYGRAGQGSPYFVSRRPFLCLLVVDCFSGNVSFHEQQMVERGEVQDGLIEQIRGSDNSGEEKCTEKRRWDYSFRSWSRHN